MALGTAAALVSLTACRSSPQVAAYVGDTEITEARVTQLTDSYNELARKFVAENPGQQVREVSRSLTLTVLLRDELCNRLSRQLGFSFTPEPAQTESPELLVISQHADACIQAIPQKDVRPTEDDYRAIYDQLLRQGRVGPGDYEAVKQQLMSDPSFIAAVSREKALGDVAEVTVNPRYGQISIIGISPIGELTNVVEDRPPTAAPPQQ